LLPQHPTAALRPPPPSLFTIANISCTSIVSETSLRGHRGVVEGLRFRESHQAHSCWRLDMAATTSLSFFRPSAEEPLLKDVLARVNLERGHFRNITEASLQEEVAGEGALESSESEDEDDDDEKEDGEQAIGKPPTREDLYKAKMEMLQHVAFAENEVLLTVDFISLLLSKEAPALATSTMSPALRADVPIGTLGMDLWHRMPEDKARKAQDELLATNVRMESLQKSADSLLVAANRLQDNVRKETQYWDEVLSISEKGWNVCRLPGQQHRLGVTFGFSESSPEYSRRGIAALNVGSDGNIALDRGIGAKPKALRVQLRRNYEVVGSSRVPFLPDDGETTLEARIRHARDSLFDEELYQEIIRESRSQASLGVTTQGTAVCFSPAQGDASDATEVLLELVSLDDLDSQLTVSHPQDALAQAIALSARLLLTQAHRERMRERSDVPPPLSAEKREEKLILPVLRPIMSFVLHQSAQTSVNAYLGQVAHLLSAAQVENKCEQAGFSFGDTASLSNAESLIAKFMQPWVSESRLETRRPDKVAVEIKIRFETTLAYDFGTTFTLTTSTQRNFRFSLFSELREATDAALISVLAQALAATAGEGWKCNAREGMLTKAVDDGGKGGSAWVSLSGRAGMLSLSSLVKKASWSVEGESEQKSLRDAFSEIAR